MKSVRRCRSGAFALLVVLAYLPAWGQDSPRPDVEGSWEGVVVYVPAEQEVELAVDLFKDGMGKLAGLMDIPTKPIEDEPISAVQFDGTRISWELRRDYGTFTFSGTLSADGNEIRGESVDRGKSVAFTLRRRDPAAPEKKRVQPALHILSASGAELKEKFNADTGKVRLVMLLSPGCMYCTVSARVVQRYVLDKIADERLVTYVVWGSYKERETEADARGAAPFVPDPRATHFWSASIAPGDLFKEPLRPLGLGALSAWDSFLLFAPETRWEDTAPAPVHFMHRHVEGKPLNGERLFDQVRSLLDASEGRPRGPGPL